MSGGKTALFTSETFRFFKQLKRNNYKEWMEENRQRYKEAIVLPFRGLLEEVRPAMVKMDERFDVRGKTGANFSRINRDIRFAKDKTLYKTHMYLTFQTVARKGRESGQLYVGLTIDSVTVGFRIYAGAKRKESVLATVAAPRIAENPGWVKKQKTRLGKKYESYWYETVKGEWMKRDGWPTEQENWRKIGGWIVRKKMTAASATRESFVKELPKIWKELYPLLKFTSLQ